MMKNKSFRTEVLSMQLPVNFSFRNQVVQSQYVLECHKKKFLLSEDKINVNLTLARHTCILAAKCSLYIKVSW